MLLNVVAGVAVIALFALLVALFSGSVGVGWFTVGASAVGIVLLIVDELSERLREQAEAGAGGSPPPSLPMLLRRVVRVPDEQAVEELRYNRHLLRPDIWPPVRAVSPGDPEEVQPEARHPLRPDIWP